MTSSRFIAGSLAVCLATSAHAQVSPSLVFQPWKDKPHWADTYDEPIFIPGGHTKGDDGDIDLFYYDSYGRVKLDRENSDPNFWLAYRALTIGIDGDQPELPGDLNDIAIAGAFKLSDGAGDWTLNLSVGAGTANDGHWSNAHAIYGIGTLNASREIDEDSTLHVGLSYQGNRTFLPDAPLPYFVYQTRVDSELVLNLGLPAGGVEWEPLEPLTFSFNYTLPTNLSARVTHAFNEHWSMFGEYARTVDGFFLNDEDDTRLFYTLNRVSAGIRWIKEPLIDVRIGAGYAFDQEFSRGFDIRDLDTVAQLSDEVLFFFTVQGTF